jgi:hypothetical protein
MYLIWMRGVDLNHRSLAYETSGDDQTPLPRNNLVPQYGIEPHTDRLQGDCSTDELQGLLFYHMIFYMAVALLFYKVDVNFHINLFLLIFLNQKLF